MMKQITILIVFISFLGGCKTAYQYSIEKPIEGQIYTATKLKNLMSLQKYEEAILLFSEKEQANIREMQKNKEMFEYWCYAWRLNDEMFAYYIALIKKGQAHFIFEKGAWKINEK
jgi:hypothetical protein